MVVNFFSTSVVIVFNSLDGLTNLILITNL